jgi:hypothetical protein
VPVALGQVFGGHDGLVHAGQRPATTAGTASAAERLLAYADPRRKEPSRS